MNIDELTTRYMIINTPTHTHTHTHTHPHTHTHTHDVHVHSAHLLEPEIQLSAGRHLNSKFRHSCALTSHSQSGLNVAVFVFSVSVFLYLVHVGEVALG